MWHLNITLLVVNRFYTRSALAQKGTKQRKDKNKQAHPSNLNVRRRLACHHHCSIALLSCNQKQMVEGERWSFGTLLHQVEVRTLRSIINKI